MFVSALSPHANDQVLLLLFILNKPQQLAVQEKTATREQVFIAENVKTSVNWWKAAGLKTYSTVRRNDYDYICIDVCVFPPQFDGVATGFISVTSDVDLKRLHDSFELSEFDGLYKQIKHDEPAAQSDSREDEEEPRKTQISDSQQVT